jgi:hypothetical protein
MAFRSQPDHSFVTAITPLQIFVPDIHRFPLLFAVFPLAERPSTAVYVSVL